MLWYAFYVALRAPGPPPLSPTEKTTNNFKQTIGGARSWGFRLLVGRQGHRELPNTFVLRRTTVSVPETLKEDEVWRRLVEKIVERGATEPEQGPGPSSSLSQ